MSRAIGLFVLLLAVGSLRAQDANAWLKEDEIPRDHLAVELNAVAGLAPEAAEREARKYQQLRESLQGEGKQAAALVEAVAWEQAGSPTQAKGALELIA